MDFRYKRTFFRHCKQKRIRRTLTKTLQRQMENMVYKTLVAYASKSGATKEASEIIADVLKNKYKLQVHS